MRPNHPVCATCQGLGGGEGPPLGWQDCPDCKGTGFPPPKRGETLDAYLRRTEIIGFPDPRYD